MMRKASVSVCLGLVAAAVALGCGRDRTEPATTMTTGAVSNDDAIMRIASARCDREVSCNNLGQGKKFADREACMREGQQNARGTLRADQCPNIDQGKLSQCVNDIKNQRCENPIDAIDTITSCTRGNICIER